MNKKILVAIIATLISIPTTSYANKGVSLKNSTQSVPTLAILDTALDTSLPHIKSKLIYEVCILEWNTCPNGASFMEGTNSSILPAASFAKSGFDHGTQMASAAIQANPNMNIVFVRIIGQNINGDRQIATEATIYMALDWVIKNKDRFNIQSVSLSQGNGNHMPGTDYCTKTPITEGKIKALVDSGVPVFTASGNGRNYTKIDWPSCIPSTISIGAATRNGIELYSNHDSLLLDFYANPRATVITAGNRTVNATGTSIATQVAAASWLAIKSKKPNLNYSEIYDLIKNTSRSVKGRQGNGRMIDLPAALNG